MHMGTVDRGAEEPVGTWGEGCTVQAMQPWFRSPGQSCFLDQVPASLRTWPVLRFLPGFITLGLGCGRHSCPVPRCPLLSHSSLPCALQCLPHCAVGSLMARGPLLVVSHSPWARQAAPYTLPSCLLRPGLCDLL